MDACFNDIRSNYSTYNYVDGSLNNIRNDIRTNYATYNYVDGSFTDIRTNYATNESKTISDSSINYIFTNYATTNYINNQFNTLLNGAPDALNSLNELAIALNSDVSFGYNAYGKIASSDASINSIRAMIDASLSGIVSAGGNVNISPVTAFNVTAPLTNISGNLDIGNGLSSVVINKDISAGYALDVSGFTILRNTLSANTIYSISGSNMTIGSDGTLGSGGTSLAGGFIFTRNSSTLSGIGSTTTFNAASDNVGLRFGASTITGGILIAQQQTNGTLSIADFNRNYANIANSGSISIGTGIATGATGAVSEASGCLINIGTGSRTNYSAINIGTGRRDATSFINIGTGADVSGNINIGSGDRNYGNVNILTGATSTGKLIVGADVSFNGRVSIGSDISLNGTLKINSIEPTSGSNALNIGVGSSQTGTINIGIGGSSKIIAIGGSTTITYLSGQNLRIKDTGHGVFSVGRIISDATTDSIGVTIASGVNTTGSVRIMDGSGSTGNITIGRSNVISIVNSATPTLSISAPIQPTYATAPNANTMIGFIATPAVTVLSSISGEILDIGSFSLTAGTWVVQARVQFGGLSTTAAQFFRISFSTVSKTHGNLVGDWNQDGQSGGVYINYSTNFQLTGTTTIYCVGACKVGTTVTTSAINVYAIRIA